MKKIILTLSVLAFIGLLLVTPILAEETAAPAGQSPLGGTPSPSTRRQEIQGKIKDQITAKLKRAAIGSGKLTAISGAVLTVDKDGKSYIVNTGTFDKCTTKIVRRFGAKSEISEMSIGDILNIIGYWTDDTKTAVNACVVRDRSIQIRFAVFVGEVKSLTDSGWVMSTVSEKRPDQTIVVSDTTKFVDRRNQTITRAAIQAGHKVRVRGLWNNQTNTVTEVQQVKDFSLPLRPTVSLAP